MKDVGQRSIEISALKHAIPYLALFRGRVFVIKLGGAVLDLATTTHCTLPPQPTLRVVTEDFRFTARLDVGNPLVRSLLGRAFFPDLVSFFEREYRDGVRPQLTVAVLDGRAGFVGVSGEVFCGHALSLRRRARLDHLLFCGYCNDYHQYFPTIEAASEGGYGTAPPIAMAELGAGERMMDRALLRRKSYRILMTRWLAISKARASAGSDSNSSPSSNKPVLMLT